MRPKSRIDRRSESLIRAAGNGASIDSASSINPGGSTLQTFQGSGVRSEAPAVSGATEFHSTPEAHFTASRSTAQRCEQDIIKKKGNKAGKQSSPAASYVFMMPKLKAQGEEF